MILITSIGEFLLYYCQFFFFFHFTVKKTKNKKKQIVAGLFLCRLVLPCFYCKNPCFSGLEYGPNGRGRAIQLVFSGEKP